MKGTGKKNQSIAGILFVMVVWGSSFAITKSAVAQVPPICFALLRFCVASLSLLVMMAFRKRSENAHQRIPFKAIALMGCTGVLVFYLFFNYALVYTSATMGSLIQAFIPVFVAVLAIYYLKEKISGRQAFSILLSIAGVVMVSIFSAPSSSSINPVLGNTYMLLSVLSWSVYTILSKKYAQYDVLKLTTLSTCFGTLLLLPFALLELRMHPVMHFNSDVWLSILYLGILASALSYYLYNLALQNLSAALVGIFINLDPVIGAAIAMIFLKEKISLMQLGGGILILAGMWISLQVENQKLALIEKK